MNGASSELTVYETAPTGGPVEPIFLRRVRLRARRLVLWLQHVWTSAPGASGLSISYDEVDRILRDGADLAREELAFYESDPAARALTGSIDDADAAAAADAVVERLRCDLGLEDAELDLLTLTVAVEADPWLRRVFGYIHDDATHPWPTPWLAQQLFQWPAGTRIGPSSGLIRWKMARPIESHGHPWSVTASWIADPFAVSLLIDGTALDPSLGPAVRLVPLRARFEAAECLYPSELATIVTFVGALDDDVTRTGRTRSIEVLLAGPHGSGKRTLATQACIALRRPLLVADAASLAGQTIDPAVAREAVLRVVRTARLLGAAVYWQDFAAAAAAARDLPAPALSLFGTSDAATPSLDPSAARRTIRLPSLTQAMRAGLWGRLSDDPIPPPVLDWPLLPADIARAALVASAGPDAVIDACRATARLDAVSLASPLPRPYVWTDLVLSPSVRRHLDELEMQARWRWPVYEDWGFGRMCPMGRGITALFAGPSGTGKTMAAQVLARSLGMEIYRVDLAAVMSKYIGETEKHLAQVFDACERANVLLFFDEADALFGRRMQIKDAHDRFANIEIDYLLQRMEQFDGIAVLATNRKNEIDTAFVRRVRFIVDFLMPGVAERRELWTRALPSHAPGGEVLLDGIDWDSLAQRLTMSGADIKSAAIGAAFLARAEGVRIGMSQVLRAARRELAKHGIVVRAGEIEA